MTVRRQILQLFMGETIRRAPIGSIPRLALSAVVAKLLSSVFVGLAMSDAIPFAAAASWIPAQRGG